MKKTFGILLFAILIIACNHGQKTKVHGQKTKVIEKWDNGDKKIVYTYYNIDDTLTYTEEYFYENGKQELHGKIVNDKQEGNWQWYYENGNKKDESYFSNGHYINRRIHWYENGKLKEVEFFDGQCEGDCCDGKVIFYNQQGNIRQIKFIRGENISVKFFDYYPNGKISEERNAIVNPSNDSIIDNGKLIQYFENGIIELDGSLDNSWRDGKWIWKDSLGNIVKTDYWNKGVLAKTIK